MMEEMAISETVLLSIAALAARRAGEYVLGQLARRHDAHSATQADVKHKLDVEAQAVAMETIRSAFPDHPILGEESASLPLPDHDYLWIVDPIDGTVNFFHGSPWWCCSVAVRYRGVARAAAVFAPELGRMFTATALGEALCNGVPIHVSENDELAMAMVSTGSGGFTKGIFDPRYVKVLCEKIQRVRINGAAALDLCMVAAGATEAYFEPNIFHWDMAAGSLIVERAGGTAEILKEYGNYRLTILATNKKLHHPLRELLVPLL